MFSYNELKSIQEGLMITDPSRWDDFDILNKLDEVIEDFWKPGTTLPPMNAAFVIRFKIVRHVEFKARRTTLATSYAPEEVVVQLLTSGVWETHTLKGDEFQWRYL